MISRDNIIATDGEHNNILVLDDEPDITTVTTTSIRKNGLISLALLTHF